MCTGRHVHSNGDALLDLFWPGRASDAVTLTKLECLKQAYCDVPPPFQQVCIIRRGQVVQQPWRGLCKSLLDSRGRLENSRSLLEELETYSRNIEHVLKCMYLGTCIAAFIYS